MNAYSGKSILVVEDDKDIQEILTYNLKKEGFFVFNEFDGARALDSILNNKPNLVILDLMLPGMSGIEICKALRKNASTRYLPIIMLTARSTETDKIKGFEEGADDYVTKPFSNQELVARIKALFRREGTEVLSGGGIVIDSTGHKVMVDQKEVPMTLSEFKLLKELVKHPGRVLTRGQLTQNIMGDGVSVTDRTIDVHLTALRKKIGPYAEWIETVRGVGYRFRS